MSLSETRRRSSSICAGISSSASRNGRPIEGLVGNRQNADAGVAFQQPPVDFLDARDDLFGVHGPSLGVVQLGLSMNEHPDEDRLDHERDRDQEQPFLTIVNRVFIFD